MFSTTHPDPACLANAQHNQVLALNFNNGYTYYADLAALVGEHRAQLALERCVDVCRTFTIDAFRQAAVIASSPYINPDQLPELDNLLTAILVEVLKTMHEGQCFSADLPPQSWELVKIAPSKIFLKPPSRAAELQHPVLGPRSTGLIP